MYGFYHSVILSYIHSVVSGLFGKAKKHILQFDTLVNEKIFDEHRKQSFPEIALRSEVQELGKHSFRRVLQDVTVLQFVVYS